MPVAGADRLECLMVGGVEVDIGEVEVVFLVRTGSLDFRGDGIECEVAGDDIGGGVFPATC